MKIQKKEVAILLTLVLLLGCLGGPVRIRAAEDNTETVKKGKIEMSHTSLESMQAGTEFKIQIHIHDMDSFAGLTGTFTYVSDLLEIPAVSTGSAISVAPKTVEKSTVWNASLDSGTNALEVKLAEGSAPVKLDENQGLEVTIPFKLKQDSSLQKIEFKLTNVTVFTGTDDGSQSYTLADTDIKPLTIEARRLGFEFGSSSGCEEILLPLKIKENSGISGFTVEISCDNEADKGLLTFSLSKQTFADDAKGKFSISDYKWKSGNLILEFITTGMRPEHNPYTGDFLNLVLNATRSVDSERNIPVTLKVKQIQYGDNTVPFVTSEAKGVVTLKPIKYTLGHVRNPEETGKISILDVLWIVRAYRREITLNEAQQKAADVDQNNTINLNDATILLKYYNEEIKSL